MRNALRGIRLNLERAAHWVDVNLLGGSDWNELVLVRRSDLERAGAEIDKVLQGIDRSRSAPPHFKSLARLHLKTARGALERMA
jgi:hypothetical protein